MLNLRNEASAYHGFGDSFCCITAVKWDAYNVEITSGKAILCPAGGTLGISGWGCATGSLEPLTFTRASSAEFCYPILE